MRRRKGLKKGSFIFLLISSFALSPSAHSQTLEDAAEFYRRGELDEARRTLMNLIAEDNRNPNILLFLGKVEVKGEPSKNYLEDAIYYGSDWADSVQARLLLCKYEFSKGMNLTAVELSEGMKDGLAYDQIIPELQWISGCAFLAMEKTSSAEDRFDNILTHFPHSPWAAWARLGMGDCFLLKGNNQQAISAYNQILDLYRGTEVFHWALSGLRNCYVQLKDPEKALLYNNLLKERFPQSLELTELLPHHKMDVEESKEEGRVEQLTGTRYTIQLGVFGIEDNALRIKSQFQKEGHSVRIENKIIGDKKYFVVQLGSFISYQEASALKKRLETQTKESYRVVIK